LTANARRAFGGISDRHRLIDQQKVRSDFRFKTKKPNTRHLNPQENSNVKKKKKKKKRKNQKRM